MTKFFKTTLAAMALSLATAGAALADRVDLWEYQKYTGGAYATDCRDCEEDRGIDLGCKFGSPTIDVSLPGAASEFGRKGKRTHVIIKVGGWKRLYRARMGYQGLIGYVPEFKIDLNNPLFSRLAMGTSVTITFQGQKTELSLNGSARALKRFVRACRSEVAAL